MAEQSLETKMSQRAWREQEVSKAKAVEKRAKRRLERLVEEEHLRRVDRRQSKRQGSWKEASRLCMEMLNAREVKSVGEFLVLLERVRRAKRVRKWRKQRERVERRFDRASRHKSRPRGGRTQYWQDLGSEDARARQAKRALDKLMQGMEPGERQELEHELWKAQKEQGLACDVDDLLADLRAGRNEHANEHANKRVSSEGS